MTKFAHDDVLDAPLIHIRDNASRLVLCDAYPTTFAEADEDYNLGEIALDTGDFAIADGTVSGRKLTVAAQSEIPILVTGTVTHYALLDDDNSKILYVTDATPKDVGAGSAGNTTAWAIEFRDPAAA